MPGLPKHSHTHTSSLQAVSPSEKLAAYAELLERLAEARQKTLDAYAPTIRSSATYRPRVAVDQVGASGPTLSLTPKPGSNPKHSSTP